MLEIDNRSSVAFAEEQQLRGTTWPVAWKANAMSLNRAFEELTTVSLADVKAMFDDVEPAGPSITASVLMLGGFVVENLLKGLAAKKKKIPIVKGRPKFVHHGLVALALDAEVDLSAEEEVLLQRLTEFIMWAGRYPAPQNVNSLRGYTNRNGGFGGLTSMSAPTDFADTSSIIARLFALLDA
ncbi:hypothetical protein NHH82_06020 [Oxalobacteraceae bacterium OTU3REALA1]|nr:hypothetical protein NHH82_06020 [Oxalobacteraceae bacterium OTU3REALA1]